MRDRLFRESSCRSATTRSWWTSAARAKGVISKSEFTDAHGAFNIKAGDRVDVFIESRESDDGLISLSKEKADKMKVWDEISSACERDEIIEGTISQRVKGGLSVTIRGGVKAFLPGSQVDLRPIRNLEKLIGQTYEFKVIKFNKKRGNIVLSRRVLLEKERDTMKQKTLENLERGHGADRHHQEPHRVRRVRRSRRHRRPAPHHRHVLGSRQPPERSVQGRRPGHGQGAQVQRRDRAREPGPEADPGRPVEPRRRGLSARQARARQGHEPHRLRRLRRARARRRGPDPRQRDELDQEDQASRRSCSRSGRSSSARCSRSIRAPSASASA